MQVFTRILVRFDSETHRLLVELGYISEDQGAGQAGFAEIKVPANSDASKRLLESLVENGIEHFVQAERQFTRKEVRLATALRIDVRDALTDTTGIKSEGFDWSEVCEHCMRVPSPTGVLRADPSILEGHAFVRARRGEIVVNDEVALRMVSEGISGAILRPMHGRDDDERPLQSWFQLIPIAKLPHPVTPPTRFVHADGRCEYCGRGGLWLDSMLYYDVSEDDVADINVTEELFGEGPEISPEIVVSQRFYNLLVACGAKLDPEPVMFV